MSRRRQNSAWVRPLRRKSLRRAFQRRSTTWARGMRWAPGRGGRPRLEQHRRSVRRLPDALHRTDTVLSDVSHVVHALTAPRAPPALGCFPDPVGGLPLEPLHRRISPLLSLTRPWRDFWEPSFLAARTGPPLAPRRADPQAGIASMQLLQFPPRSPSH